MVVQEYRQTASWGETVKFGRSIAKVIEDLPNNEEYGFITQLQQSMVNLPAAVGKDLQYETIGRFDELVRLHAIFGLIETIYPAIDIAQATADLGMLNDRLASGNFTELPSPPATSATEGEASADEEVPVHGELLDPNATLEGPALPDDSTEPAPISAPAPIEPLTEEPPGSV